MLVRQIGKGVFEPGDFRERIKIMEHKTSSEHNDKDDPVINWLIWGMVALGAVAVMGLGALWLMMPRRHTGGQLTACKSNLKNIGTAYEMYSTDFAGKYPPHIGLLTPNYLKTIPECPEAQKVTYKVSMSPGAPMNPEGYEDYYYVECYGANHTSVSVTANYPAYNGIQGLIERAP
jgi:hypothetical protein